MSVEMPTFGNLQGMKVISSGIIVAGPFAPSLFAENGAEVIHIESTQAKDILRMLGPGWAQEHRNQRVMSMNIPSPEGREVFAKMLADCDIFIESSKPGTWDKWGWTDEELWAVNPKLIIAHVSGFGQTGDPDYVRRPAYDPVAQAFSGYANLNGPEEAPRLTRPYMGDYLTGFQTAWATLAAYIRMQTTGVGESIDVAMYETLNRIQAGWAIEGLTDNMVFKRFSGIDLHSAGEAFYECKNGKFIFITLSGPGSMKRGLKVIGLDDDPDFDGVINVMKNAPYAEKFVQAIRDFCADKTDVEVEAIMNENSIACGRVYDYQDIAQDPHYEARGNIIDCYDPNQERDLKMFAPSPRFKNNPQQVWCAGGVYGADNDYVLKRLGYDDDEIAALYEKEVLKKA